MRRILYVTLARLGRKKKLLASRGDALEISWCSYIYDPRRGSRWRHCSGDPFREDSRRLALPGVQGDRNAFLLARHAAATPAERHAPSPAVSAPVRPTPHSAGPPPALAPARAHPGWTVGPLKRRWIPLGLAPRACLRPEARPMRSVPCGSGRDGGGQDKDAPRRRKVDRPTLLWIRGFKGRSARAFWQTGGSLACEQPSTQRRQRSRRDADLEQALLPVQVALVAVALDPAPSRDPDNTCGTPASTGQKRKRSCALASHSVKQAGSLASTRLPRSAPLSRAAAGPGVAKMSLRAAAPRGGGGGGGASGLWRGLSTAGG